MHLLKGSIFFYSGHQLFCMDSREGERKERSIEFHEWIKEPCFMSSYQLNITIIVDEVWAFD